MHVSADEKGETVVIGFDKFEILALGYALGLAESGVKLRQNALAGYFIAAGDYDEHIFPLFVGLDLVNTMAVGLYYFCAVRYQNVADGLASAQDKAVDVGAGVRLDVKRCNNVEVDGAYIIVDFVAADINSVCAAGDSLRQGKSKERAVVDISYGTNVVGVGGGA